MIKRPAIFLDRDGTLNVEKGYLYRIEDWEWIPGALEAIRQINSLGYLAIVVTNQAGIARGYYDASAVNELHKKVDHLLKLAGAHIDAFYFCPHHPMFGEKEQCSCRKPAPGMLRQAQRDLNVDLDRSWLIGDRLSDVEAGFRAGVSPILVQTGYGEFESADVYPNLCYAPDVLSAVLHIESVCSGNFSSHHTE